MNPLLGTNPLAPVQSAVSWVVLAAARRERGDSLVAQSIPGAVVSTSDLTEAESVPDAVELTRTVVRPAAALAASTGSTQALTRVAAVEAADPISAFIGQIQAFVSQIVQAVTQVVNQVVQAVTQAVTAVINVFVPPPTPVNSAPVATSPTVRTPDPTTGLVTGQINATDPNGDTLTYSSPTSTAKGTVMLNTDTGAFTYTPTATARTNAAALGATLADMTDTFTVTVTDGKGGSTTVPVSVVVSPAPQSNPGPSPTNRAPVAGTPVVGTPNASTGVVTGSVTATDADGDTLTYSGSTTTSKGGVTVAANGSFTYTPTAAARNIAGDFNATAAEKTDTFLVTITDGRGGTTSIPISVAIAPKVSGITAAMTVTQQYADEGNAGASTIQVPVQLSTASSETVTVYYRTEPGGATPNVDYIDDSGSVVFAPGQTQASISVGIVGDTSYEGLEGLYVRLIGATNAQVVLSGAEEGRYPSTYVLIRNDDQLPPPAAATATAGTVNPVASQRQATAPADSAQTVNAAFASALVAPSGSARTPSPVAAVTKADPITPPVVGLKRDEICDTTALPSPE